MKPEDITSFMDISDLKGSARSLALVDEIIRLEAKVNALESLLVANKNFDSYALSAAEKFENNRPEMVEKRTILAKCFKSLKYAIENPQARLKVMFDSVLQDRK